MDSDGSPQKHQTVSAWRPEVPCPSYMLISILIQGGKTNEQETKSSLCSPGCRKNSGP